MKSSKGASHQPATDLVTSGRQYSEHGIVSPGVYHASTILYPNTDALRAKNQDYTYGRKGTPTSRALEETIAQLEGGHACRLTPSGLAAVSTVMMAFLNTGDHVLVTDSAYRPTRTLCDGLLQRMGIETTFYDPLIGADIGDLMQPNTKLVMTECPGSQTFEMQDIPAIVKAAHGHGALVAIDNTWSGGHYFKAFEHGCDISFQAATKYLVGHSDCMMGSITVAEQHWDRFKDAYEQMGMCAGPDDMYLTLRGIRTLDVRLERHMKSALDIAGWLRERDEVAEVLHPGLPGAPGNDIWKRDFRGSSGLFGVVLKTSNQQAVDAFLNTLTLYGMGYSWGGFESLVIPCDVTSYRTATTWDREGHLLRLHIGLEDVRDLKKDLENGFKAMAAMQ
ncbi:MAG: cystathionine beta-lyase [Anderseniella sp.]